MHHTEESFYGHSLSLRWNFARQRSQDYNIDYFLRMNWSEDLHTQTSHVTAFPNCASSCTRYVYSAIHGPKRLLKCWVGWHHLLSHPVIVEWEQNNEKQVDKNYAACKEKKTKVFYSLFLYCNPPLIKSLMYGTLGTTRSTSVRLDHSCGDLAPRCSYLLDKQSHIFCRDYPQLLHSEVFSCPLAQMTKINPFPKSITDSSRGNTGMSIPQMKQ